ncbi:MAG: hypothetical protein ABIE94_01235 [archaeon]
MKDLRKDVKKPVQQPQKETYMCTRCNYKFKFNPKSNHVLMCPYCSKSDKVIKPKTQTADRLLKNSDDSERFYA